MELQVALDLLDREMAIEIVQKLYDFVDIIEVGTPLIIREGLSAVSEIKNAFPCKMVLADIKIMDAGKYEALLAFENGADIVTVLGVASDSTVGKALDAANSLRKRIMVDLIGVRDIRLRCRRLQKVGVDIICVHTPFDLQATGTNPLKDLFIVKDCLKKCTAVKIAVAGGLNPQNIDSVLTLKPDIVVVGGGIINAPNMREAAQKIAEKLRSDWEVSK